MTRAGELDRDVEKNAWKQRGGWLRDAAELEQTRKQALVNMELASVISIFQIQNHFSCGYCSRIHTAQ